MTPQQAPKTAAMANKDEASRALTFSCRNHLVPRIEFGHIILIGPGLLRNYGRGVNCEGSFWPTLSGLRSTRVSGHQHCRCDR